LRKRGYRTRAGPRIFAQELYDAKLLSEGGWEPKAHEKICSPRKSGNVKELKMTYKNILVFIFMISHFGILWGRAEGGQSHDKANTFNGHEYILSQQRKNWPMAVKDAESRGGYLVVINSPEEQAYIEKLLAEAYQREKFEEPVWIGFTDEECEGNWKWVNGEEVKFTFWQKGQPTNANGITAENYAVIWNAISGDQKGQWNDIAGDSPMRYIVEIERKLGGQRSNKPDWASK